MKKNPFTLIEIIFSIGLIALAMSTLSFSLSKLVKSNQFDREIDTFQAFIQQAYDLVLHYEVDIDLNLYYKGPFLICEINCDQPHLLSPKHKIKKFRHLKKNSLLNQGKGDKFCFSFSYFGSRMPPTYLVFVGPKNETVSFLIKGFPYVLQKEKKYLLAS
ncbi:MAG: hypothetical protein S4CHLAM7_09910 [Chlamydiae bacterium]|nr:hypothetical protein [Chlamydiota bacterium]